MRAPAPHLPRRPRTGAPAAPALALAAAALLLLAGCSLEEPALPTFTTHVAVPLGRQDLTVAEMIDEHGDYLVARSDSLLGIAVEGDTTTVVLDMDLAADVPAAGFHTALGAITLDSVSGSRVGFALSDLYPPAADLPPVPVDVPPFTFDVTSDTLALGGLESAHVRSGLLAVTLRNDTAIPLSGAAPPERLTLELLALDGRAVGTLEFPLELASGDSATAVLDLAGSDLPGRLRVRVAGGSAGASGVTVDPAAELAVTVTPRDIVVDAATAVVGALELNGAGAVALPDSVGIIDAVVASGTLVLTTASGLPVPGTVTLRFPEIRRDGEALRLSFPLPADSTVTTTVDLAGCRLTGDGSTPLDSLRVETAFATPGSGGELVTFAAGDEVAADTAPFRLAFAEVTGQVPERTFPLDSVHETVDLPEELNGLTLPEATLVIDIFNETGVGGLLDFTLTGTNARGERVTLAAAAEIGAARSGDGRTSIVLDQDNSNVAELLSSLPRELDFSGQLTVGGPERTGTVRPGDAARVTWRLAAPVRAVIAPDTELRHRPEPLGLSAGTRDDLSRHLVSGELTLDVDNHFPFGAGVRVQVGPDSLAATADPELVIGPLDVAAGDRDPVDGTVVGTRRTHLVVPLSHQQVQAFLRPDAHVAVSAVLPGSDGRPVALRLEDMVSVTGAVRVEIRVEDE